VVFLLAAVGCNPTTTRPYYPPVTGAAEADIRLDQRSATAALADVLRSDSLPLRRVEIQDGYLETEWFTAGDKRVARGRKLGPDVVQIRAWVDPTRQGYAHMRVETVYRPVADASLTPRELDREVAADHPVGKRVAQIVTELVKLYSPEPVPPAGS
jgi:hypothetical protein